jgi:chemotaxis protein CheY-P-specific phosphatase CheC
MGAHQRPGATFSPPPWGDLQPAAPPTDPSGEAARRCPSTGGRQSVCLSRWEEPVTDALVPGPAQTVLAQAVPPGMRRAGRVLARMSGRPIVVSAPHLVSHTPAEILHRAGGPAAVVVAVYAGIWGGLSGHALLLFSPLAAHRLANLLLGDLVPSEPSPVGPLPLPAHDNAAAAREIPDPGLGATGEVTNETGDPANRQAAAGIGEASTTDPSGVPPLLDELAASALQEAGNVAISTFLNELGSRLGRPVFPTPPQLVVEMAGAVLQGLLLDLLASGDGLLAAETSFHDGERAVEALFLVLPRLSDRQREPAGP